jgi:hypothetical protein
MQNSDRNNPNPTTLLIIDVQKGLFAPYQELYQPEQLSSNIKRLLNIITQRSTASLLTSKPPRKLNLPLTIQ